ncbi:hypothetical protein AB0K34_04860 [Actinomadura sp. NPDC049382]|uniref:hypothetical protein n=1 Tax=Actinomadura sp. NPDC049382 TaxID=3158220 RepID=UPI003448F7ED
MAEASWPDPANGRVVSESEYEKLAARFSDDGILNGPFDSTPVVAGAGLQVLIQPGFVANVRGFAWESGSTEFPLTIDSNNLTAGTRLDWVVLRLDRSTWQVRAAVRKGTPGAGRPALVRNLWGTGVYEIPLALVSVPVGASSVDVTPYPLYVGSRIRFATGFDEPDAAPGALRWSIGGYDSYDGSAWTRVIGDTGWINLNLDWTTVWSKTSADTCAVKLKNGIVGLKVSATRKTFFGRTDPDGSQLVTLPIGMRPVGHPAYGVGQFSSGDSIRIDCLTDGRVVAIFPSRDIPAGATLRCGVTFPI